MKRILTLSVLAVISTQLASARLGETLEQMKIRFGDPQPQNEPGSRKLADGRELQVLVFGKEGVAFTVSAIFLNGKVILETYIRVLSLRSMGEADLVTLVAKLDLDDSKDGDLPAINAVKKRVLWPEMKTQLAAILDANSQGKTWTLAPFEGVVDPGFKEVEKGDRGLDAKCQFETTRGLCKAWTREDGGVCRFQLIRLPESVADKEAGKTSLAEVQEFMVSKPLAVVVALTREGDEVDKLLTREQEEKAKQDKNAKEEQKKKDVGI
jgi:hypothetical protein